MISPYRIAWARAMGENGVPKQWCLKVLSMHMGDFGRVEEPLVAGCTLEHSWCASIAQLRCGKLQRAWVLPLTPSPIHVGTGRTELAARQVRFEWEFGENCITLGEREREDKTTFHLCLERSLELYGSPLPKSTADLTVLQGRCSMGTEHFKQCLLLGYRTF